MVSSGPAAAASLQVELQVEVLSGHREVQTGVTTVTGTGAVPRRARVLQHRPRRRRNKLELENVQDKKRCVRLT